MLFYALAGMARQLEIQARYFSVPLAKGRVIISGVS